MRRLLQSIFLIGIVCGLDSCVDDAKDVRDPLPKDSPDAKLSTSSTTASGGDVVTFSLNVTDAPGILDSLGVTSSDDLGTWTSTFESLRGSTSGTFSLDFTMPFNFDGDFTVSITVYDAQTDSKTGELARKFQTNSSTVALSYLYEAPTVAYTDVTAETIRGTEAAFTIDISEVAPDGVATVVAASDLGTVTLNSSDLAAIVGKTSGTVRGSLVTSETEIPGNATITAVVTDTKQERSSEAEVAIAVVYEFGAPTLTLNFNETAALTGDTLSFSADVSALGTIDTITAVSVENVSSGDGPELGEVTFDAGSVEAVIGKTSGTVTGTFVSDTKGFIDVTVSVTDKQGRTTDKTVTLLLESCDPSDIAGTYSSLSSGNSGDVPTGPYEDLASVVEVTGDEGLTFEVSDLSFGLFELQGFDPETGTISTCGNEVISGIGDNGFIDEVTGTINEDGTITLVWSGPFGDSGTTTLTPQ